jgi:hypothetical protein
MTIHKKRCLIYGWLNLMDDVPVLSYCMVLFADFSVDAYWTPCLKV